MGKLGVLGAIVVMVLGCAPSGTRDMVGTEREIVGDTIEAWNAWAADHPGYSPVSDWCYNELMGIGVYVAHTHGEMLSITGRCGPDSTNPLTLDPEVPFDGGEACPSDAPEVWGQARTGYADRWRMIVMVDVADWCTSFPHEVLHHLAACMGYSWGDWGHEREFWADLGYLPGEYQETRGPEDPTFTGCPPL